MGKIFDALEKHKKEESLGPIERLPIRDTEPPRFKKKKILPPTRKITVEEDTHPKLVVESVPGSVDAENFKVLRAQVLYTRDRDRPRTIMVTSAFPGEGKTFVAANLAVSISTGLDEHALLVDCDLRRPSLHSMLSYSNTEGLHEFLSGGKDLSDLIIRTRIEKLSFLPAGGVSPKPSELLASSMMTSFLHEVRDRYDDRLIILDAAPLQVTAEATVLSNHVDGVIFVVMAGKTPREIIQKAIEKIGKEKILGIVFNGYSNNLKRYGKYYKGYYH